MYLKLFWNLILMETAYKNRAMIAEVFKLISQFLATFCFVILGYLRDIDIYMYYLFMINDYMLIIYINEEI